MSIVMYKRNKIHVFPLELYDHLIRRFNGVVQRGVLKLSSSSLLIQFEKFDGSSNTVPVHLLAKLIKAMKIIRDKYLTYDDYKVHTQIKFEESELYYIIKITGLRRIPPGKIFNLFALILWAHIKYISGVKPSASIYGRELTEKWKLEEAYTLNQLMESDKLIFSTNHAMPCFVCGETDYLENNWKFFYQKERRYIDVSTRVCQKHRGHVI
ncbi:MAG: hypothetical protein INQ03_08485 [Candidatus Heimdallarchaeota archaeon]|nr:hypothetical protein [Candidatus Heimdallarchaeota archaeon]